MYVCMLGKTLCNCQRIYLYLCLQMKVVSKPLKLNPSGLNGSH